MTTDWNSFEWHRFSGENEKILYFLFAEFGANTFFLRYLCEHLNSKFKRKILKFFQGD